VTVQEITAYAIDCDGNRCTNRLTDVEEGGILVFLAEEQARSPLARSQATRAEWSTVGNLHFCEADACQAEARKERAALAARAPLPVLPGQLALIGEVAGVPVTYGEVTR